jgi:hypothetical protein
MRRRSGEPDRSALVDRRAEQVLEYVRADARLLEIAERHRQSERLEALCRRFAAVESTAAKSCNKLRTHLEYRERHAIAALAELPARKVFNSADAQLAYNRMMPHGLLGADCEGRPVLYKHLGRLSVAALTRQGADLTTTLRYNEWLTERLCVTMRHLGQWTIIIDLQGISLSQIASMKWMLYVQSMSSHDALHYPDRLAQLFLINVPSFFASTWELLSKYMGDEVRAARRAPREHSLHHRFQSTHSDPLASLPLRPPHPSHRHASASSSSPPERTLGAVSWGPPWTSRFCRAISVAARLSLSGGCARPCRRCCCPCPLRLSYRERRRLLRLCRRGRGRRRRRGCRCRRRRTLRQLTLLWLRKRLSHRNPSHFGNHRHRPKHQPQPQPPPPAISLPWCRPPLDRPPQLPQLPHQHQLAWPHLRTLRRCAP